MKSVVLKTKNIRKYVQSVFFFLFIVGVTTLVKIPATNKLYKLLLVALVFEGIVLAFRKKMTILHPILYFLAFSALCSVSALWSIKVQTNTIIVVFMVTFACSALYIIVNRKEDIDIILIAFIIAVIIEFFYNLYRLGISSVLNTRMALEGFNSNQVGSEIAYASIICLYFFEKNRKKRYLITYLFLAACCLLTGSRTALILYFAGGCFFFFHLSNGKERLKPRIIIGVLAGIAVLFLIFRVDAFYKIIGKRIINEMVIPFFESLAGENIGSVPSKESNYLRWNMIKYGLEFFFQRPFLGAGIGNYVVLIAQTDLGFISYAHNNYIELLTDVGIIGFTVYYIPYLLAWVRIIKSKRKVEPIFQMSGGILLCMMLDDLTGVNYYMIFQRFLFTLIICIIFKRNEERIGGKAKSIVGGI